MDQPAPPQPTQDAPDTLIELALRGGLGGVLMGLANLVPGISGGTMLLAAGVYPRFIAAIGEVTTLKFRRASIVTLGSVVAAAVAAVLLFAGPVKELVIHHRWVMYALFIGLTLGGVPVIWRLITDRERTVQGELREETTAASMTPVWVGAAVGFIAMAALGLMQATGAGSDVERDGFMFMFLAGVAGASAMILPGVSGGYLLLVLGVYLPILAGIDIFKDGLRQGEWSTVVSVGLGVVLPVGLGVLVGVAGVSNLLRWLLRCYEKATLGVLLGLLVGAVIGLWPFQQTVPPAEGQIIKSQNIAFGFPPGVEPVRDQPYWYFAQSLEAVEAEDLPTAFFTPTVAQAAGALGLIAAGFGVTLLIDKTQGNKKRRKPQPSAKVKA